MVEKLKSLRLGAKLGLGFAAVLLLTVAIVGVTWQGLTRVDQGFTGLVEGEIEGLENTALIEDGFLKFRISLYQYLAAKTPEATTKAIKDMKGFRAAVDEVIPKVKDAKVVNETDVKINSSHASIRSSWKNYAATVDAFMPLAEAGDRAGVSKVVAQRTRPVAENEMQPALQNMLKVYLEAVHEESSATSATIDRVQVLAIVLAGLALAAGALVAFFVTRAITQPVNALSGRMSTLETTCLASLSDSVRAMAKGDFTRAASSSTAPIESASQDEIGQACRTFNAMLSRIQGSISDVNAARSSLSTVVSGIRDASGEVWSEGKAGANSGVSDSLKQVSATIAESAHTAQEMASGSEALAMTASQAASNMEEMDRSIIAMGSLASQVLDQAGATMRDAKAGEQSLGELVAALELISTQSNSSMEAVLQLGEQQEKIGSIVRTIEEISDQTNLLALNAAIEAARAGEHGRGFAVVAEEVRKLAERAGTSTKEIAELIQSIRASVDRTHSEMTASVESVQQGQEVGRAAAQALSRIAGAASSVEQLAQSAQGQAKELATRAGDVNGLVSQVASISQESAAGSEEISAGLHEVAASATQVSADLGDIAERLNGLVQRFTIEEESRLRLAA